MKKRKKFNLKVYSKLSYLNMIKSPIQKVTNKMQYRAIGIVNGIYNPHDHEEINKGFLIDNQEKKIEAVVLGKSLSIIKKHIDLKKSYFWIVYPKNKNTQNLHLQIAGIWDPCLLNDISKEMSKKNTLDLLKEFHLKDNYFSIRGELVYVNIEKKEIIIKICSSYQVKKLKNHNFKLVLKGEIPIEFLNHFVSLDVFREGNNLRMIQYEVIQKISPKKTIK